MLPLMGRMLDDKILSHSKKAARGRGVSAAAVQAISISVYALAFWIGGWMMDAGRSCGPSPHAAIPHKRVL